MEQGNRVRQAPQGIVAPAYEGPQPAHMQQQGMISTPIPLQRQFLVDCKSEVDGQRYQGQFTVRKLSVKDIAKIGVRTTQLNGGFHHDPENPGSGIPAETNFINQMIAYLEVAVLQAPHWFNLEEIYDADLLGEIFQKAAEFENNFFRTVRGQNVAPGSGQDDSSGEGAQPGAAGFASPVVGGEVPDSLEP